MSQGLFSTGIQPCCFMLQNHNCTMSVPLKNTTKREGAGPFITATHNNKSRGFGITTPTP